MKNTTKQWADDTLNLALNKVQATVPMVSALSQSACTSTGLPTRAG